MSQLLTALAISSLLVLASTSSCRGWLSGHLRIELPLTGLTYVTHSTIDGDLSDFFDIVTDLTATFQTDRIRAYLAAIGHPEADINAVLARWKNYRLQKADPAWNSFRLTPAGIAAVRDLRARPSDHLNKPAAEDGGRSSGHGRYPSKHKPQTLRSENSSGHSRPRAPRRS